MDDRLRLFARLWGVAAVAHVVGNWQHPNVPTPVGLALLTVGLCGAVLAITPSRRAFVVLCAAIPISAVLEAPRLFNHWLLAAMVSLVVLLQAGRPERIVPAARLVFLVFYACAAFHKLNTGYFAPATSCGLFFANQSLAAAGLPVVAADSPWAWVPIVGSAAIELAVPPLLIARRTRIAGVGIATVFHVLISFDLAQHFYDFTAVLLALLALFLPVAAATRFAARVDALPAKARRTAALAFTVLAAAMVGAAVVALREQTVFLVRWLPFVIWIPFSLVFVAGVIAARGPTESARGSPSATGVVLALLTAINGLTPYVELKTAGGFNMYSNLVTAQGRSNHWVVRRTWPLRDGYAGPVEIVDSSDAGLRRYRDRGYRVAWPELRRYLAAHPDVSLTYRREGRTVVVARAGDDPILSDGGPWWWRFFVLRALDTHDPPRCQDSWLPAS